MMNNLAITLLLVSVALNVVLVVMIMVGWVSSCYTRDVNAAPLSDSRPICAPFGACSSFGMVALLDPGTYKNGNIVLCPSIVSSPAINSRSVDHFNTPASARLVPTSTPPPEKWNSAHP